MDNDFKTGFEKIALSKYELARAKRQGIKDPSKYEQVGVFGKPTIGKLTALISAPLAGAYLAKKIFKKGR